jgi:glycerol-3-phosphate dehydrogenase
MRSETALLIPKTEDGRVIFAIPWFGSLLVGTTEDEVDPDAEMAASEKEIDYLLSYVNRYLDTAFTSADVKAAFAGARPLVASENAVNTKKLIRDHEVEVDLSSGLVSVLGGKWTTYRAMAEDGVNAAIRLLGDTHTQSKTLNYLLDGAKDFHDDYWCELVEQYAITEKAARHLAQKFGTRAVAVLDVIQSQPRYCLPLYSGAAVLAGEVVYCVREEMAQTIADVLARRVGIQFHSWHEAVAAAPIVGELMGIELGWSHSQTSEAVESYVESITHLCRIAGLPSKSTNVLATTTEKHSGD